MYCTALCNCTQLNKSLNLHRTACYKNTAERHYFVQNSALHWRNYYSTLNCVQFCTGWQIYKSRKFRHYDQINQSVIRASADTDRQKLCSIIHIPDCKSSSMIRSASKKIKGAIAIGSGKQVKTIACKAE